MAKHEKFPFEISEAGEEIAKNYPDVKERFLFVGPKKFCVPKEYKDVADLIYNFEVRNDDVWVYGYPRSGTTLTQEAVWLLGSGLNYEKAAANVLDVRFPVIENCTTFASEYEKIANESNKYSDDITTIVKKMTEPAWKTLSLTKERRFIKTHLLPSIGPRDVLHGGCKVIYVARNPKDVCVSQYKVGEMYAKRDRYGGFQNFWDRFRQGLAYSTPFLEHVKEGWELRHHDNVLFLFYEEFTKEIKKTLVKLADFLETKLTDQQLDTLANHLKIDNFRKNKSVNNDHLRTLGVIKDEDDLFIRKGKTGGWRDYFLGDLNVQADRWIEENLRGTDLKFPE